MNSEEQIQQAQRPIHHMNVMMGEANQLEDIAAQLMAVQRVWNAPKREAHLAVALADSRAVWHGIQSALPHSGGWVRSIGLADVGGVSTSVPPGRVRNRTKTELDEKVKKPAGETRKKSPPARKVPARGRYVDEYARPAI